MGCRMSLRRHRLIAEAFLGTLLGVTACESTLVPDEPLDPPSMDGGAFDEESGSLTSGCVGDVNGDAQRTITDVIRLLNHIVGNLSLTETERAAADVDGNGSVTVNDAIKLQNAIVGNT